MGRPSRGERLPTNALLSIADEIVLDHLLKVRYGSRRPPPNRWSLVIEPLLGRGQLPLTPARGGSRPRSRDEPPKERVADAVVGEPLQEGGMKIRRTTTERLTEDVSQGVGPR